MVRVIDHVVGGGVAGIGDRRTDIGDDADDAGEQPPDQQHGPGSEAGSSGEDGSSGGFRWDGQCLAQGRCGGLTVDPPGVDPVDQTGPPVLAVLLGLGVVLDVGVVAGVHGLSSPSYGGRDCGCGQAPLIRWCVTGRHWLGAAAAGVDEVVGHAAAQT